MGFLGQLSAYIAKGNLQVFTSYCANNKIQGYKGKRALIGQLMKDIM
jgi:hypothetical protein